MRYKLKNYTTATRVAAGAHKYELMFDTTLGQVIVSDGSSWTALTTATTGNADAVYNAGAWTVAVDANDVIFNLATGYNLVINAAASGTTAQGLVIDDGGGTLTTALLISGSTAVTTAIDVSDSVITTALNVGAAAIVGTTGIINYSNFDVDASGNVTCNNLTINNLTIGGTWSITSALNLGSDGIGVDLNMFSTTVGDKIVWDASERTLIATDSTIQLGDNDELHFGTAAGVVGTGDFKIYGDGTHLQIQAVANVASQAIYIGNDTNELDIVWEGTTNGSIVTFDSSADQVIFATASLHFNDSTHVYFGTGSDFDVYSDGTDLLIAAGADVANQAVKIGSATNDIDLIVYGDTTGNSMQYDSSADQLLLTGAGAALTTLALTSTSTSASSASMSNNAAIADNIAILTLSGTGNIATGGNILRLSYATGTPNTAAVMFEMAGTGKDLQGIYVDVDSATNHMTHLQCGGALAANKAVLNISGDAAANASSHLLLIDGSNATWATNNPIQIGVTTVGTGPGIEIESTNTGALGAQFDLRHTPGNSQQADNDVVGRIRFYGQDDAAGATENLYGYIDMVATDSGAGSEDSRLDIYVQKAGAGAAAYLSVAPDLVTIGSGATGYLSSNGAYDLVLETNSGTDSGTITITDAANGNIAIAPNGTGDVLLTADTVMVGDNNANATITTNGTGDLILNTNAGTNSGSITIQDAANGDILLDANGTGSVKVSDAAIQFKQRDVAAGTTTDAPNSDDGLIQYATDAANACAVTLPEAANNLGLMLTFEFDVDGGKDVVISRTGADTIDTAGDTGNTTATLASAAQAIVLMAIGDNIWLVITNLGATLV